MGRLSNMAAGRRALLEAAHHADEPLTRRSRIARRPEQQTPVLSFAQQRLWVLARIDADSAAYNLPAAIRIEGPLDSERLHQSLQALVDRHEVLRTGFRLERPEPFVRDEVQLPLQVIDVHTDEDIERIAIAEGARAFPLDQAPLLRALLLRKGEQEHVLVLNLHHLVADGRSVQILASELGALYLASARAELAALPPLPLGYGDYAAWQRRCLQAGELDGELEYWKARLQGSPPVLELPLDRPRPSLSAGRGAALSLRLPLQTAEALRSWGRTHGATSFMILLAAFQAQLYRATGVEDIVLGSTIAGRSSPELEPIVGLFANTVLLRTSLQGDPTFLQLVERVRETVLGALAHQELPFDAIIAALRPERSATRTPFFGILFDYQDAPLQRMQLGPLVFSPLDLHNATAKFDLTVQAFDGPEGLSVYFEYDTELFDQGSIERLIAGFQRMIERLLATPDERIGAASRAATPAAERPTQDTLPEEHRPSTPLELELVEIWSQLLHKPPEEIGVYDGFFALGGQSLLALELLERIKDRYGVELALRTLFEDATIAGLAERIEARTDEAASLPALVRLERQESYELSPYQLPVWYIHELAPASPLYNVCIGNVVFTGDLDRDAFGAALRGLVARHAAFRTRVATEGGQPRVRVLEHLELDLTEVFLDRTGVAEADVPAEMARLAWETSTILLDLERGPIFRFRLAEFSGQRFQLVLLVHHIVWDERSLLNMGYELQELYNAHRSGRAPRLPELELDYVDFAHWIHASIRTGALDKQRQYWLNAFSTLPEPLDLPLDFPRPALQTFNGTEIEGVIPADGVARINAFLQRHDTTLYMLTSAVLDLLIHRLTGRTDFVIGTPIANRNDKRLAPLLGCFATAMPMRCRITPGMTFADLLASVRQVSLEAYDNHVYPSVLAIQELNPKMDGSRNRLFSVMMGVQNNKAQIMTDLRFDELDLSYAEGITFAEQQTSRFDFTVIIDELLDIIEVRFNFNTDLFKPQTIHRMHRQYLSLIEQVLADPARPLSDYALSSAEEEALLARFNETSREAELDLGVHERFARQARATPEAVAVTDGQSSLTYRALAARASRLAHGLAERGVGPGDRVAVHAERSIAVVAALLAVLQCGAAYVPLHPETPAERVQAIVQAADVACVLTEADLADDPARPAAPLARRHRGLAYVMFTSGTTGEPKGIEIEHRGLSNLLDWLQSEYTLTPDDAALCVTSLAFDASVLEVFWPLAHGARIVLAPPGAEKDPVQLGEIARRERVTFVQTVPIMLEELARGRRRGDLDALPDLRLVICGSAALSRQQRDLFREAFGCRLVNHYGPTEVTVDATSFDCAGDFDGDIVPIGTPVGNARVYVLDAELRPVPLGARGEIYVSSPGLARGYSHDPVRTAQSFVPDPFSARPGQRLYKTGDVGRLTPEGVLYFGGRVDRQVKVRGNRVELEEIEARLAQHPEIDACAVRLVSERVVGFVSLAAERHVMAGKSGRYRRFSLAQRPDLRRAMDVLHVDAWPEYFVGDCVLRSHWLGLISTQPQHQLLLVDEQDRLVAVGNALPIRWTGRTEELPSGWDETLVQGLQPDGAPRDTLVGLAIVVAREHEGQGLGTLVLEALREAARAMGYARLVIPVRPTEKPADQDLEAYSQRRREDGLPVDGWLRIHERAGGRILRAAPRSQHIVATLAEWERWGRRSFAESGEYTVHAALQPVRIDLAADRGEYWDPAVWVEHTVPQSTAWTHVDAQDLRASLSRTLPPYMVPDTFRFLSRLPVTANGKVDERALQALAADPASARAAAPPQTAIQLDLAEVWREVLGLAQVGILDDFFDLGGHSIHAVRMLAVVRSRLNVQVSLRDLFVHPTIASLEQLISARGQETP
jgi:amino acid adenylation domain-containing protein